MRPLNKSL